MSTSVLSRPRSSRVRHLARPVVLVALVAGGLLPSSVPAAAATSAPSVRQTAVVDAPTAAEPDAEPVLQTERVAIAFRTLRREDPRRDRGTEAVVRAGRTGVLQRTYAVAGAGGATAARQLVREERTREPVHRVVAVGTRVVRYGGLDWAALARCESGGDPRAVSRRGTYRGLYQFSRPTWRSVGGTGDPIDASPARQTALAYELYRREGRAPWPVCGRRL